MIITIAGIVLDDKKLLVVKKRDAWIFPGGKPEDGESDIACLVREFREELSGTRIDPKSVEFYDTFKGISPNLKLPMEGRFYRVSLNSELGLPSREILDRRFVSYSSLRDYRLSEAAREVVESLHDRRLF